LDPNAAEVAAPPTSVCVLNVVPVPWGHPVVVLEHSWKLTVPVTVPFDPVKVAVSVSELPMVILGELILVVMAGNGATAPDIKLIACVPSPTPSKETNPT
jgi:hypothetical protein